MTSPVLVPLNNPRICKEPRVDFYYCTDLTLLTQFNLPTQFAETYLEPSRTSMKVPFVIMVNG